MATITKGDFSLDDLLTWARDISEYWAEKDYESEREQREADEEEGSG